MYREQVSGDNSVPAYITCSALLRQYSEGQKAKDPGYNPHADPHYRKANVALLGVIRAGDNPDPKDLQVFRDLPGISAEGTLDSFLGNVLNVREAHITGRTKSVNPETPFYDAFKARLKKYGERAQANPRDADFVGRDPNHPEYVALLDEGNSRLRQVLMYEMAGQEVPQEHIEFFEGLFHTPKFRWCYKEVADALVAERQGFGLGYREIGLEEFDGIGDKLHQIREAEEDGTPVDEETLAYFTERAFESDVRRLAGLMAAKEPRKAQPESVADLAK